MSGSVRAKLSVMMFLQFFIWGAWYELAFGYVRDLGFSSWQQSLALITFNLAAFTAMFFSTQFADRHFAAEKFLAFSHLLGGLSILAAGWVTSFWPFFLLLLVHSLCYVPTLSIANSIAFASLKDAQRDFGLVRVWGTIGWIAASWPFIFILVDWSQVPALGDVGFVSWIGQALATSKEGAARTVGVSWTYIVAGISSLVLAGYSLSLPHTPPKPAEAGGEALAWLGAMKLLRLPFLMVLFVVTFLDASVLQCYFLWTDPFLRGIGVPSNWVMPAMKVSQIAEIGTMAFLGYFLTRLGWRATMILGILGHVLRFGIFAWVGNVSQPGTTEIWAAVAINLVHGICYAFFFATLYIFVDEYFPKDARSSAQGLFNFLILGAGPLVGNFLWPWLGDKLFTTTIEAGKPLVQFNHLFLVPSATALVAALLLLLFFHPPNKVEPKMEQVPVSPEEPEDFAARPRPDLAQ
ncbi:MAG TPA: MFS transporter [Gemmataceae bacterium]|nr:MFS transporter [Gemmataceae bacterium]